MAETHLCPQCQAELPPDAPGGLCPECLMQEGQRTARASSQATDAGPSDGTFVAPDPQDLAQRFPNLEIVELIGQGGMGAVYRARQPHLDRFVALKILRPALGLDATFADRFMREARALAKLSHPRIVSVYDFGKVEALHYLIMECVDGPNLRQVIKTASLSPKEALAVVPQICDALQYAHDQGVVHRDIKPENVLFDKRAGIKIADFGLAKLIDKDKADQTLTKPQQVMGTLRYMAPEQMETPLDVDHRADIYSLGVVFYEMLTGEVPMGSFDLPSQRVEVDVRLDQVVLRALERNREARYQQVSEMKTGVVEASRPDVSTAQQQAQADSIPEPTPTPSRWRGWRNVAMGIGFVAAASVAVVLLRLVTRPSPHMTSPAPARHAAEPVVRMARRKARPQQVAAAPGSRREAFTVKGISDVRIDVTIHAESTKTLALYIAERNWASGPVGEGENAVATLEVSDQIRLEGGGLGHGMIFGRRASKQLLAITKDGQIPYGTVKIRETGAISRTPDAIVVADIEATDGSRTPISLKLE